MPRLTFFPGASGRGGQSPVKHGLKSYSYDTGCKSMALLYSETQFRLMQGAAGNFQPVTVNTVSSSTNAQHIQAHVRIMSDDQTKVVLDWKKTLCNPHQSIPAHIFQGTLAEPKFICEHIHAKKQLWFASSKPGILVCAM